MRKIFENPRLIGFLVGFVGATLVGVLLIASLSILSTQPVPTPAASSIPIVEENPASSPTRDAQSDDPSSTLAATPSALTVESSATPTPIESISHTVRAGDTLFDIALAYGVSVETIQLANRLNGETITPGQVLAIPTGPLPTPSPVVEAGMIIHTVSSGETLIGIAQRYSLTVEAIQSANGLATEIIQLGRKLRIPIEITEQTSPLTTGTTTDRAWQPSILEGNLEEGYPLSVETNRFTLHYQPDTRAAEAPDLVTAIVESALRHIENKLQVRLADSFDVYVAGTVFAADDMTLRGRTFSSQRRSFFLYDDTGTSDEHQYVVTHELAHLVAWNTLGRPSSVMLHEGLSVYAGIEALNATGFIPITQFCGAYHQTGQLPSLSDSRAFLGHIRDLDLYFAAGCFVQYLIEEYGLNDFKQLYTSGDYLEIYAKTFNQLQADWLENLDSISDELAFAPEELVSWVAAVAASYDHLFTDFNGTPQQTAAYREVDQARIATLQGRFGKADEHLSAFHALLGDE